MQPGAREGPLVLDRRRRQLHRGGGFLDGQAGEIAQQHDARLRGIDLLEPRQRLVDGEDVGQDRRQRRRLGIQLDPLLLAAMLDAAVVPGALDEDAAHGDRRGGEEVSAPVPPAIGAVAGQPQVGLVDEGGRLQREAGRLARDPRPRQPAQLVVDLRQELCG